MALSVDSKQCEVDDGGRTSALEEPLYWKAILVTGGTRFIISRSIARTNDSELTHQGLNHGRKHPRLRRCNKTWFSLNSVNDYYWVLTKAYHDCTV